MRPRTCAHPTQPRLLEKRSRPTPFTPYPLATYGKARLECRLLTGEAHYWRSVAFMSFGENINLDLP